MLVNGTTNFSQMKTIRHKLPTCHIIVIDNVDIIDVPMFIRGGVDCGKDAVLRIDMLG